jgi:hypothetical protein
MCIIITIGWFENVHSRGEKRMILSLYLDNEKNLILTLYGGQF